jgi:hypothetical protein
MLNFLSPFDLSRLFLHLSDSNTTKKQTRRKYCYWKITMLPTSALFNIAERNLNVSHLTWRPFQRCARPAPTPLSVYETKLHERRFLVVDGWEVKTPIDHV